MAAGPELVNLVKMVKIWSRPCHGRKQNRDPLRLLWKHGPQPTQR